MSFFFVEFFHRLGFTEVLNSAISPPNIIATFLFLFCLMYWSLVIFGIFNISFFDFDIDLDLDTDVNVDTDVSSDISTAGSFWSGTLSFFNIGTIPFMIFLTFFSIPFWFITVNVNHMLNNESFLIGILILIPVIIISLLLSKLMILPFLGVFKRLENDEYAEDIEAEGKMCTLLFPIEPQKIGQAEVTDEHGNIKINVYTQEETLNKGDTALVIEYSKEKRSYLIAPYT